MRPLQEPIECDAMLDRLSHNLHRVELRGESMRTSDTPAMNLS